MQRRPFFKLKGGLCTRHLPPAVCLRGLWLCGCLSQGLTVLPVSHSHLHIVTIIREYTHKLYRRGGKRIRWHSGWYVTWVCRWGPLSVVEINW